MSNGEEVRSVSQQNVSPSAQGLEVKELSSGHGRSVLLDIPLYRTGNYNGREIIGTTSGSSGSWVPQLAKDLVGKKVVVMPDADEAGARFAEAVKRSLETESIEYRVVTFADVGAKDVTEFMETHTTEDLVRRIGLDWAGMPDGTYLYEFGAYSEWPPISYDEWALLPDHDPRKIEPSIII